MTISVNFVYWRLGIRNRHWLWNICFRKCEYTYIYMGCYYIHTYTIILARTYVITRCTCAKHVCLVLSIIKRKSVNTTNNMKTQYQEIMSACVLIMFPILPKLRMYIYIGYCLDTKYIWSYALTIWKLDSPTCIQELRLPLRIIIPHSTIVKPNNNSRFSIPVFWINDCQHYPPGVGVNIDNRCQFSTNPKNDNHWQFRILWIYVSGNDRLLIVVYIACDYIHTYIILHSRMHVITRWKG